MAMVAAFASSSLFLVSYVVYHALHGDTPFRGTGWIRPVYFFILISHIVLSVVVLPMVFTTFFFSLTRQFRRHRRIARWTLPLWLYVSVTGVLVFALLKVFNP
jgi:putative membrane protein